VDGDTSTNDCVIAMASGLSGLSRIQSLDSIEAQQFQACLDAVSITPCSLIFSCMSASAYVQMHFNAAQSLLSYFSLTFLHLSFCPLSRYCLPVKFLC